MIINPINQPTNQLVRPAANRGSGLPTIGHWLDELKVATVLLLVDHVWQKWGLWFTGSPQDKATLDISYFLTRYKEATIVLKFTSAKYMPPH